MSGLFGDTPSESQAAEPYRVLARKYRPSTFAEMIGQEAVVRTLSNAIQAGRLPQAWMLTGVRGIGKTTTARLIAKALNCTGRDVASGSVEPCGVCDACRAIAEDRHVDVQEMDAASRTGVDDIREIVEGVRYGPVSAKYKIYILDEVHMLSKNAFNALLKTLEEPPPHMKFIFATTEIRKVPVTVLSRCQRFDLRRVEAHELAAHYARIAVKEGIEAEDEALKLIARAADGSVRDGLSLLDQAIARGDGKISEGDVKDMLGLADRAASLDLCRHLLRGEMSAVLDGFGMMARAGMDPLQILQDLAELIHFLTRCQILPNGAALDSCSEAERGLASDLGDVRIPALTRAWQILLKGIAEVQTAPQPLAAAEMVLIRLAYAAELPPPGDLIKQLREQAQSGAAASSGDKGSGPSGGGTSMRLAASGALAQSPAPRIQAFAEASAQESPVRAVMPGTFREMVALFATNREGGLYAELRGYVHPVRYAPGRVEIRVHKKASPQLLPRVQQCLNDWTGQRWVIALVDEPGGLTLQEEDKQIERQRQERVASHPLMLATVKAFPEARLVSLKKKELPPLALSDEEGAIEEPEEEQE